MPKLPEFLFDSHKRYKADTKQLTTWLVETAKGLGYGVEPSLYTESEPPRTVPKAGRLKGKARKQASDRATPRQTTAASPVAECRRIFVNEFTKLAHFIAGSHPRIKVPSLILKLARRAIAIRKRCAQWFQRRTTPEQGNSDDTHWHFITVLEQVVQILYPLSDRDHDTKSAATVATSTAEAAAAPLVNPFSVLDIEEPKGEELCEPLSPVVAEPRPQIVVYTVVEDDDTDNWLALFCFFEDLREIRTFLRETWSDYRDGRIDLITASVTTNMAFDVIRSTQEDLLALHPRLDNYEKISTVICGAVCVSRGGDPTKMKLGDIRDHNLSDVEEFVYSPIYSLLVSLCDVIQPNMLPVYKPGHFGTYSPHRSRDSLSYEERRLEDRIILGEMLPDFVSLARLKSNRPVQDELTKELQKMVCDKEISLLLVFAAQVYLDIHHVLREQVGRGFEDLRSAGVLIATSLRERKSNSPTVKFENWSASNETYVEGLNSIIQEWILKDRLGAFKQSVMSRLLPCVETEAYFLFTRHPFFCGMLQFRLQLTFQDLGLNLATAWGTILFVSHLYEAGKHAGFLGQDSWKDMEWVMKVHDKERMFRGRVPQDAHESYKSLCLMAGISTSYFASTSRRSPRQSTKHSPKGPSFLKENSPVSAMFRERPGGVALTAEALEELLSDRGVDPSSLQFSQPQITKLQQQWVRSHKMTPLEFLATLRAALVAEQHMIRFDYVSLHMRCIKLLREIKATLHEKFVECYGEGYFENETQLSWLVVWVLYSATESAKLMKRRDGSALSSHGLLLPASRVVDGFLKREGDAECTKLEKALQQTSQ